MTFDAQLTDRVRETLGPRSDLSEREMFGGIGFMIAGNMACGVMEEELIVRLSPEEAERALTEESTRQFDFTGRPTAGWIFVASPAIDGDGLGEWVDAGAEDAAGLPPK